MQSHTTNRRKFIQTLAGISDGAVFFQNCKTLFKSNPVPEGEEWKNRENITINETDNYKLTPELEAATAEAIEKYRKGKFTIRILSANNKPLQGVKLKIGLQKHHFDWGYSSALQMCENSILSEKKTKYIKELFNCTTAKCYWDERWHQPIEHNENKRILDKFLDEIHWGLANGLRVKGHPLVWTVRKAIPEWMDKYPYKKQIKILEAHVRDLIQKAGQEVTHWDLCNEMLWEPSLRNLPRRNWPHIETIDEILSYLEPAVHWAKQENPYAIYSLNDYGLVKTYAPGVTAKQQRNRYVTLINEMKKRGCAPDAIGTQCHVAGWYSAKEFTTMLNDLSQARLPVQVTEFWAHLKDYPFNDGADDTKKEKLLVENTKMIYTLAFAHPLVAHFTYWGGKEWFDNDANPTKLYHAVYELIKTKWATNTELTTNTNGEVELNAFFGEYQIIAQHQNGNQYPTKVNFRKNNPYIVINSN